MKYIINTSSSPRPQPEQVHLSCGGQSPPQPQHAQTLDVQTFSARVHNVINLRATGCSSARAAGGTPRATGVGVRSQSTNVTQTIEEKKNVWTFCRPQTDTAVASRYCCERRQHQGLPATDALQQPRKDNQAMSEARERH